MAEDEDPRVKRFLADVDTRFAAKYPLLARNRPTAKAPTRRDLGKNIYLGDTPERTPFFLPERLVLEHMHLLGAPGSGKTNALELFVQQAITNGRGLMLIDPHGEHPDSLYRRALAWIEQKGYAAKRTVHIVDPNGRDFTFGFNPLAVPDPDTDLSVIADATLEAVERVWDEDMHDKPTIQSILTATFTALAELGLAMTEAKLLFDVQDRNGFRANVISRLTNEYAIAELEDLHEQAEDPRMRREFKMGTRGAMNRLNDFLRAESVRLILGQTTKTLDLLKAMDEGHIILVNLQQGRGASTKAASVLGTLLLRYALFFCSRRNNTRDPFFIVADECHNVLSGDLTTLLPEARKFGVGIVLAHQYLHQLRSAGEDIYQAVRSATRVKMVFGLASQDEAEDVAREVIPLDFELPKQSMIRPTVVGQKKVKLWSASHTDNQQRSSTTMESRARMAAVSDSEFQSSGAGSTEMTGQMLTPDLGWFDTPEIIRQTLASSLTKNESVGSGKARSFAESESVGRAETQGTGNSDTLGVAEAYENDYKDLPTQLYSKEELIYLAGRTLRTLSPGHAFAAFRDKASAVKLPLMPQLNVDGPTFDGLRGKMLRNSPSAKPADEAKMEISERVRDFIGVPTAEPANAQPEYDAPEPTKENADAPPDDFSSPEPVAAELPKHSKPRLVVDNGDPSGLGPNNKK